MSIEPLGDVLASSAGSHRPQTTGADAQRVERDIVNHQRRIELDRQAQVAAGIGETEPDYETRERDADGRRPLERQPPKPPIAASADAPSAAAEKELGQSLDLTA